MAKTIEEIINKIKEKISTELDEDYARELLTEIGVDLIGLKKSAEKKHKEIVEKKIKELKEIIDKSRSKEELSWPETQDALGKVKDGLNELKNEIIELEKLVVKAFPVIETNEPEAGVFANLLKKGQDLSSALIDSKVTKLYEERIEELKAKLEKAEKERDDYKNKFETKDREVFELENKKGENKNFSKEVVDRAHSYWVDAVETGVTEGSKVFPVVGSAVGGLLGATIGGAGMTAHVGGYVFEKVTEEGKEYYKATLESGTEVAIQAGTGAVSLIKRGMDSGDEAVKELKDFTQSMASLGVGEFENLRKGAQELTTDAMNVAANSVESWRKGWENVTEQLMSNTTSVFNESINVAQTAVEGGIGFKYGDFQAGIGVGRNASVEAKLEAAEKFITHFGKEAEKKEEEIENLKQEIKQLKQEGKQELREKADDLKENRDEIMKSKDEMIEQLKKQIERQEKLIDRLENREDKRTDAQVEVSSKN